MKVKKLTKTARKVLCAILTAAMVFADTGIAVYAEERAQAQESMTAEEQSVEVQESVMTEEAVETQESAETQESVTAEETEDAGRFGDSLEREEETEQTVTEEASVEEETETSQKTFPDMAGFSETNLKIMRLWYRFYAEAVNGQQVVDKLRSDDIFRSLSVKHICQK